MKKTYKWIKRIGIILVVIVATVLLLRAWMFPHYEEPIGSGSHIVKMETFTWVDESRIETFTDTGENRALTVGIWYPQEEGNYPLVIFSHGAFGVLESNYSTYVELASNGYVVASIGHPYHAAYVEDVNGNVTIVDMEFIQQVYENEAQDDIMVYKNSQEWMTLRTADMNFVLNTILENVEKKEGIFAKINTENIGLMGHSLGGATAVQLGRERNDIDAVIDLEGSMLGEYVGFENGVAVYNGESYPVPVLDVNSRVAREQIQQTKAEHPEWDYVNDYLGKNAVDYREVIFNGAGHLNFTDLPLISPALASLLGVGEVDAAECMEHVNEIVKIFFDYYLKNEGSLENIKAEY